MTEKKPIAILGWGSLLWDLEVLGAHVEGFWQRGAGPVLPIEFTRISPKRKRGLALCIDPMHGAHCFTSVITSRRSNMLEARRDLARRERAADGFIGGVCLETRQSLGRTQVAREVWGWCERSGYSGAVWTDLVSNYPVEAGEEFSVKGAIAYLHSLEGESLAEAVRYIELAPHETNTPLRRALAEDPRWREHKARVLPQTA